MQVKATNLLTVCTRRDVTLAMNCNSILELAHSNMHS